MSATPTDGATPLDPDESEGLIPTHVTTREQLNRLEQENIVEAMHWLETARLKDILDETFIRKLHQRMFGRVWKWAGQFRTSDKNIGIAKERIGVSAARPVRGHQGANRACFLSAGRDRLPVPPSAGVDSPVRERERPPCQAHHRSVAGEASAPAAFLMGRDERNLGGGYPGGLSGCPARGGQGDYSKLAEFARKH